MTLGRIENDEYGDTYGAPGGHAAGLDLVHEDCMVAVVEEIEGLDDDDDFDDEFDDDFEEEWEDDAEDEGEFGDVDEDEADDGSFFGEEE